MFKKDIKKINDRTYFYKDEKSIFFVMNYTFIYETSRLNDLKAEILSEYLNTINTKYDTPKKIFDKKREIYSPILSIYSNNYHSKSIFNITYRMIEPKRVKDDYFDNSLEFFYDMIFNPYIVNNKLNKDRINVIKSEIYDYYINSVKDFHYELNYKYDKSVLNGYSKNTLYYDSKEELKKDLDSITDKDIIDFYNMVLNNHYKTLLYGNFNKEQINRVLNKIKYNGVNNSKIDYKETINLEKGYNEYISKEYTQSVLFMTYRIKDVKKYSTVWYKSVIQAILWGMDGYLFHYLRLKYGLVYSCGSTMIDDSNIISFEAFIDKKNKDKTIKVVNEMINDLKDIDKVEKRLNMVKGKIKERVYLSNESPYNIFDNVYECVYKDGISEREYIKKINQIEAKDIVDFFSNLEDENIFFYVGDKDE